MFFFSFFFSLFFLMDLSNPGMQWNMKHEIQENDPLNVIHWVKEDELAIATKESIQVYKVNADESILVYSLTSDEWDDSPITSLATNGANPDAIYVICDNRPCVYQFPCQASTQYARKHTILDAKENYSIAANDDTAVIGVEDKNYQDKLVVCKLPDFTQQRSVDITTAPWALCIASHYLLVGGESDIQVKSLNNMNENVQTISLPNGMHVCSITLSNDATQMYVACTYEENSCMMKYTWHGNGTPLYAKSYCSCIHADFGEWPTLSLSSADVLAIHDDYLHKVNVYALE